MDKPKTWDKLGPGALCCNAWTNIYASNRIQRNCGLKITVCMAVGANYGWKYTKNPKNNTPKKKKKLLELINEVSNVAGYKVNKRNLWCFYTLIMNYQKEKFEKQSYLQLPKKDKLPRNKFNQGG